jgi:hypothetical protein
VAWPQGLRLYLYAGARTCCASQLLSNSQFAFVLSQVEAHAYYSMKGALNKLKGNRFWAVRKVRRVVSQQLQPVSQPMAA